MSAPLIGVTAARERARWGHWDQPADLVPHDYVRAVQAAGGVALLLPADARLAADAALADALLAPLHGLILTGGIDLDPAGYDAPRHPATGRADALRDGSELALLRAALARDLPLLAVCRGMQLLNVAHGGTLHQHLPELLGHDGHNSDPGRFDRHPVRLEPGSLAAAAAGAPDHVVCSHHHQGVDRVGDGLRISGRSVADGLPEALELPDRRFALGVQWHPEADPDSPVVGRLVAAASALHHETGEHQCQTA